MSKINSCSCLMTLLIVIIFSSHNIVFSEVIKFQSCPGKSMNQCEIASVAINPCPEAKEGGNGTCNYFRGTNITLTINFTPKFNATKLTADRFSNVLFVYVRDITYNHRNACLYTTPEGCPIKAGNTYTFHQVIPILSWYPTGLHLAKYTLSNEKGEECCFKMQAAVV